MENKANINKYLYFTDLTVLYNIFLEESEKVWGSYTCGEPIFDQEIADFLRTFKKRIKHYANIDDFFFIFKVQRV
ncbi:MAG: hypothetical protein SVU94_02045 [Bacteroidota bacterium]|nr:hypothetical protein [Bacteroidota bacterium]